MPYNHFTGMLLANLYVKKEFHFCPYLYNDIVLYQDLLVGICKSLEI